MAGTGIVVTVRVDGARETLEAFRRLPADADKQLRDASQRIATALAGPVKAAAMAEGRQAALMAGTVTVRRDRIPVIQAGGSAQVGRRRKPAYKLLFGSEFGATRRRQFKPHRGSASYWFFRTVEEHEETVSVQWRKAADDIIRHWSEGGG